MSLEKVEIDIPEDLEPITPERKNTIGSSDSEPSQPQEAPDYAGFYTDEETNSSGDREYMGSFEGPEKTLEMCFRPMNGLMEIPPTEVKSGLRRLERHELDRICRRARCTILSCVSNQYLDAYILSESSLFVYSNMIVLKTCGTTTLLRCVAVVLELARNLNLELEWAGYSRKNFSFPGDQAFPHQSFNQEMEYLNTHRKLSARLDGAGYTLGPITGDHWFCYVADQTIRSKFDVDTDRVLNIMMFDIDESVGKIFYYNQCGEKKDNETDTEFTRRISMEMTKTAGIDALCPGAIIDPRAFEPCGYSMNAILFRSYSTMHITPEEGSSYASFETNEKLGSYTSLVNNVIRAFRPKRFAMTLMADEGGLHQMKENPFTGPAVDARFVVPFMKAKNVYKRRSVASIQVEDDCCCMMGNWVLDNDSKNIRAGRSRGMTIA